MRRSVLRSLVRRAALSMRANALRSALVSDSVQLKTGALAVAGALREGSLATVVAEVARDEALVPQVVLALTRLGAGGARTLLSAMGDLSIPARMAAAESLVHLSDPSLVEPLAKLSRSDEPELQLFAIKALGHSQSAAAIPSPSRTRRVHVLPALSAEVKT